MRALCASIIATGALVGLGLAALGLGTRYQGVAPSPDGYIHWKQLDMPMMLILVILITTLLSALAATFLGLAYHHERRNFERHGHVTGAARVDSLHS